MSPPPDFGTGPFTIGSWGGMYSSASRYKTREEQLVAELDLARTRLREITKKGTAIAYVIDVDGEYVTISNGPNQAVEVKAPTSLEIEIGDSVRVNPDTAQIVAKVPLPSFGEVALVRKMIDDELCEVLLLGAQTRVVRVRKKGIERPKREDRVLLDATNQVVVKNLGPALSNTYFTDETHVTWDDIGGQDEAKRALIEAIEDPVRHKDVYARYCKRQSKGALLYGPPGCGKTLLGKAAATALADVHGKSARETGFLYVKGPELLNKFVGSSEENVRQVFTSARTHAEHHGYPAIVFVDEADSLLGQRGRGMLDGMERTIVPMFLAEMDGLGTSGAFVLLATNRPDTLDPAVVRKGRIDVKVNVRRPTAAGAVSIFARALRGVPIDATDKAAAHASPDALAKAAAEELYSPARSLGSLEFAPPHPPRVLTLGSLASGAMIVGLVEAATTRAIRRELAGGKKGARGVRLEDFRAAVADELEQNRDLEHPAALEEMAQEVGARPVRFVPTKRATREERA